MAGGAGSYRKRFLPAAEKPPKGEGMRSVGGFDGHFCGRGETLLLLLSARVLGVQNGATASERWVG